MHVMLLILSLEVIWLLKFSKYKHKLVHVPFEVSYGETCKFKEHHNFSWCRPKDDDTLTSHEIPKSDFSLICCVVLNKCILRSIWLFVAAFVIWTDKEDGSVYYYSLEGIGGKGREFWGEKGG